MLSYRCSNRGLLLLLLFACLSIFSCQKDFNSESEEEQISFEEARHLLTSPTEIHFFDFSFASRNNPHVVPRLSGRDAQQSLDAFAYELLQKNIAHHYISNLVADIGYPHWNGAIAYTNSATEKPVIFLPFAHLNADAVQGFLIATQLSDGIWTSHLYTRPLVDSLINIHTDEILGLGFVVSVLVELDLNLFGETSEAYILWLKNLEDDNLQNVLTERCQNSITFCFELHQVFTSEHTEERSLFCHTYYFCDGNSAGFGTILTPQTGCYFDQYNQWICNYTGPVDGNGGGSSVGSGNGGSNGGDYISDLLHSGLISEDLWNDLMSINGTSPQSTASMIWLIQNKETKEELLAFINEYGSAGAAVVQAVTQQDSEETRLHALAVMRFAMSGEVRLNASMFGTLIGNPLAFQQLQYLREKISPSAAEIYFLIDNVNRIFENAGFIALHSDTENNLNLARMISKSYVKMLASDDAFGNEMIEDMQLGSIDFDDPVWEILGEQIEILLKEVLIDQIPGGILVTVGPLAIQQFKDGDWLGGLWTTLDIVLNEADAFIPWAKIPSIANSLYEKSVLLKKVYKVMKEAKNLGSEFVVKFYETLRTRFGVLEIRNRLEWLGYPHGAKLDGVSSQTFFQDLKNTFGSVQVFLHNGNPVFKILTIQQANLAVYMETYSESGTGWSKTIAFYFGPSNANEFDDLQQKFKIRFDN